MRAFAVLGVMLYHGDVGWARGGFLGVDVFFVLSGFLITSLLLREHHRSGRIDFPSFLFRRARRLLPALFAMLLIVAAYSTFATIPPQRGAIRWDGIATLLYVANWRFIFEHASYFQQFTSPSPLKHAWSLAIEEQWYLCWPLVTAAVLRWRGRRALLALAGGLAVASIIEALVLYHPGHDPSRVYYGTDTRAQALLIGSILAIALTWQPVARAAERIREPVAWAGLATLVVMMITVRDVSNFTFEGGLTLAAIASGALVLGAAATTRSPLVSALSIPPLRFIGQISYGLYLYHWPLYVWLDANRAHLTGRPLLALRIAATFVVAIVSYYVVERPVRERRFRWTSGRRRTFAFSLAGGATVVAGLLVASTAGAMTDVQYLSQQANTTHVPLVAGAPKILIAGDSVALTMHFYMDAATQSQAKWTGAERLGCGVMRSGFVIGGQRDDPNTRCDGITDLWRSRVNSAKPDLVVMVAGAWEVFDHVVDGKVVSPGTPAFDAQLRAQVQQAADILTSGGAPLVLLDVPCYGTDNHPGDAERSDPRRAAAVNAVYDAVAAHDPKVTVLRWSRFLCPGGHFQAKIDGSLVRSDGVHFTQAGAAIIWKWLTPRLVAEARAHRAAVRR